MKWQVYLGSAILVVVGVGALFFHEGRLYEAKRDTVVVANEGCFLCWAGLTALNNTNHTDRARLLDSEMDLDAMVIADMAMKHPHIVGGEQLALLRHVRDYRLKYGRNYTYDKGWQPNPADVDRRIKEALDYQKTLGGTTNLWLPVVTKSPYIDREFDALKHGK